MGDEPIGENAGVSPRTEAERSYNEAVEINEIVAELLTYPHPPWQRIAALAERLALLATEQSSPD
jgi:hypothetical protein